MKRHSIFAVMGFVLLFALPNAFAIRLLTSEQALAEMFPDAEEIVSEVHELTPDEIGAISNRLGGSLVHYQSGSDSEDVAAKTQFTLYYGMKGGEKMGVALIDEQPGKWGPVEFVFMLDLETAKVKNLAVMSYKEKRGRPIARKNFLNQFVGKGSGDPIRVRKDIRAISGATISSDAVCFAAKKAIAMCEVIILEKELAVSGS